jgi:hypothetical protein
MSPKCPTKPNPESEIARIMAATVLSSPRAIEMSLYVVRAFLKFREILASNTDLAGSVSPPTSRAKWKRARPVEA